MSFRSFGHALALFVFAIASCAVIAQNPPAVLVVPSKVTMVIGETHTFRAVDKDGRMLHDVRWSVSPEQATTLLGTGDEATLQANQTASRVILTASAAGDIAEANIEIRSGMSLPTGSVKWSVTELPGCKTTKIIPAVPSAGGPDVYVQETCPDGTYIRAITDDGRELWRRRISDTPALAGQGKADDSAEAAQHLDTAARSICLDISPGMSKEDVAGLVESRNIALGGEERKKNSWLLEESGSSCLVWFDQSGVVLRKKKIIVTELVPSFRAIDVMGAALGIVISEIDSEHPSRQAPAG